jgi:hypothetical protein
VARNPEDDVALFGKRDSTLRVFIRPKVLFTPRVNSLRFRILESFRFLATDFRTFVTDFRTFDSLRRFRSGKATVRDQTGTFRFRFPRTHCAGLRLREEREVRCFSPKV